MIRLDKNGTPCDYMLVPLDWDEIISLRDALTAYTTKNTPESHKQVTEDAIKARYPAMFEQMRRD